jgi:hypothetical protein
LRVAGRAHPLTEHGYESAVEEWEDDHARPLLARTVLTRFARLIRETEQSVSALLDERPLAGVEALRSLATWAGAIVDRLAASLGATAPGTITKGPGRQPPGRALGL